MKRLFVILFAASAFAQSSKYVSVSTARVVLEHVEVIDGTGTPPVPDRDKGIFLDLTPTFYEGLLKLFEPTIVMSPAFRARRVASDARRKQMYDDLVQRTLKSGVKFAAGSDMCWSYPGKTCGQASVTTLINLRAAGMTPLDAIRAITTNAAEMLGWQDRIGAIEPGKFADLIAVAGDPLTDVSELERVRFVMKAGEVVRNHFATR